MSLNKIFIKLYNIKFNTKFINLFDYKLIKTY